ncbi:MAG: hypothetical protein K6G52_03995 [Treponemataceae bacterium]|nr:hypothetical protein [Treponemataceae bacterium]
MKKRIVCALLINLIFSSLFAQNRVGFFAAVSDSQDTSTIKLTEDLYFSKASLLPNVNVVDYRNRNFSEKDLSKYSDVTYVFYPEIQEEGTGWICTFHGINLATKKQFSLEKKYDLYYKILMDAKTDIENFLISMEPSSSNAESAPAVQNFENISIDNLAGTWKGENFIDKIMILNGGRGFIIFESGASMNISVSVNQNHIVVRQNGRTNPAFFPDVPANIVLQNIDSAEPIVWNLEVKNLSTLEGQKYTMQENSGNAEFTQVPVIWKKL